MNNATFAGRLGRDAETRQAGGKPVTNFSLAVDEYAGQGEKRTLWIDCAMWGERGEKLAQYLAKGANITVAGQVGVRTYDSHGETRAVLTLNVREVTLQGGKQDGDQRPAATASRPAQQERPAQAAKPATPPADDFGDDEIPFD